MVFANMNFEDKDLDNSASGTVRIDNLPVAPHAGGTSPGAFSITRNFLTYNGYFTGDRKQAWEISQSHACLIGIEMINGASWAGWSVGNFDASSFYMNGSFTYIAAT